MAYRRRNYKRRLSRNYRTVRRYNSNRRYKRTKNSLSYKVYNLTRKVNRYISTYKPEIQQVRGNWIRTDFKQNGQLNPIYQSYQNFYESTLNVYAQEPEDRVLDIKSDLCRSFKLRLFGYFGLCPADRLISHENQQAWTDYKIKDPFPQTCYLKIVVAMLKKGGGRVPQVGEVFVSNNDPLNPQVPGFDDLALITGPLQKNITSQLNILRTKVVKLSSINQQKLFKMNIKVPHYRKRINTQAFGAGEILVYYQLLCPTYLNSAGNVITPDPRFNLDYQLLYVDQN